MQLTWLGRKVFPIYLHRFSDAFDVAPSCRLYGGSIGSLFGRMKSSNFADPFKISSQQFCGSGSYGNGGGMRITPISLYGLGLDTKDFNVSEGIMLLSLFDLHIYFH